MLIAYPQWSLLGIESQSRRNSARKVGEQKWYSYNAPFLQVLSNMIQHKSAYTQILHDLSLLSRRALERVRLPQHTQHTRLLLRLLELRVQLRLVLVALVQLLRP